MKLHFTNPLKVFIPITLLIVGVMSFSWTASAQSIPVEIQGSTSYGCLLRPAKSLLVSTSGRSSGRVLSFSTELKKVNLSITKTKRSFDSVKNRKDARSKATAKKLSKKLSNLRLLKKGISACSKGTLVQGLTVDCSAAPTGTLCNDGNPCTRNDTCQNGLCSGSISTGSLSCSFSSCAKTIQQCQSGTFTTCFSGITTDEICNNIDDNCNGLVDEVAECITPTPAPTSTPIVTPTPTATNTPIATPTPSPTPTRTATPTPTMTPFPCNTANNNTNPNRCPCQQDGFCAGDCGCIIKCGTANPCQTGTCITDPNASNFGSCSGVCLTNNGLARGLCNGLPTNPPVCGFPGNGFNVSAKGCACITNNDCEANCVSGICT